MWRTLIRPAMIFVPLTCGVLIPQAHVLNGWIRWLLVFMFFMVCLRLHPAELKLRRPHWFLLLANLGMGLIPYLVLKLAGYPDLALAAFFVGITPTANAAPVVMSFLHGRVGFVVSGFMVTNLGIAVALIGLLPWVTGNHSLAFIVDVLETLGVVLLLPLVLAVGVRKLYPPAEEWPKHSGNLSFAAWSLTLFIIAAGAAEFYRTHPEIPLSAFLWIALVSLILCVVNFALGARLGGRKLQRECSQTLGQKNTTFTMYLALTFANPLVAMGPIFYVLWHNGWNAMQMFLYERHRRRARRR